MKTWTNAALLIGLMAAVGCAEKPAAQTSPTGGPPVASAEKGEKPDDNPHTGWWCGEYGVPEGECSMCSAKKAKEFKAKGDWCEKHNRADSQCFICHPELKDKYAAKYVAKYGKQPPEPEDNMPEKK